MKPAFKFPTAVALILIAAAPVTNATVPDSLSQQCQSVLDRYHSGVTPQTLTPLRRHSALYLFQTKNGHCGWGTINNIHDAEGAKRLAYATCKQFEHDALIPCTLVGMEGSIISAGVQRFTNSEPALASSQPQQSVVVDTANVPEISKHEQPDSSKPVQQDSVTDKTSEAVATAEELNRVETVLSGIILPPNSDPKAWMLRVAAVPVQQQQFCRIIDHFYDSLGQVYKTHNEIKRNMLFRDRKADMATLLPHGEFANWVVQVREVTQAADGSAAVMLQPPCRAMLGSDACQINGSKIKATIPSSSSLYRELAKVSADDFVVISGKILYAETDNPDQPLPTYAVYQAGSHCSGADGTKQEDVFVTEISYLVLLR